MSILNEGVSNIICSCQRFFSHFQLEFRVQIRGKMLHFENSVINSHTFWFQWYSNKWKSFFGSNIQSLETMILYMKLLTDVSSSAFFGELSVHFSQYVMARNFSRPYEYDGNEYFFRSYFFFYCHICLRTNE